MRVKPGVWEEWFTFQNFSGIQGIQGIPGIQGIQGIQGNDSQSHPFPVHYEESDEAQDLAVVRGEGKPVVEISDSVVGEDNEAEQGVKYTQVYQEDVGEII